MVEKSKAIYSPPIPTCTALDFSLITFNLYCHSDLLAYNLVSICLPCIYSHKPPSTWLFLTYLMRSSCPWFHVWGPPWPDLCLSLRSHRLPFTFYSVIQPWNLAISNTLALHTHYTLSSLASCYSSCWQSPSALSTTLSPQRLRLGTHSFSLL